jgi:hypothetical protein
MKTLYERISPYLTKTSLEAFGERLFICDAVFIAAADRKISSAEAGWLRETVQSRLGPYDTLREYVAGTIKPDLSHLTYAERNDQFQAFRHRWLQHLCEEYECQAVFDKVVKHLLTQKRRSMGTELCAYRSEDGAMCAVGCLISDKAYDPKIEGSSVYHLRVQERLAESGVPTYNKMKFLLTDLQYIHDRRPVILWKTYLQNLAKQHNLAWKDEHEAL